MNKPIVFVGSILLTGIIATGFIFGGSALGQRNKSQASQVEVNQTTSNKVINLAETVTTNTDTDVTTIEAQIAPGGYPEITVEVGKPVRINFKVDEADLNACNDEIFIPQWDITKKLVAGDNYVEFTPTKIGTFGYSCWMGMIQSSITVVEQGAGGIGVLPMDESANYPSGCGMMTGGGNSGGGGCCGR